jgi:hypothetical protein
MFPTKWYIALILACLLQVSFAFPVSVRVILLLAPELII